MNREEVVAATLKGVAGQCPRGAYFVVFSAEDSVEVRVPEQLAAFFADTRLKGFSFIGVGCVTQLGNSQVDLKCAVNNSDVPGPEILYWRHELVKQATIDAANLRREKTGDLRQ